MGLGFVTRHLAERTLVAVSGLMLAISSGVVAWSAALFAARLAVAMLPAAGLRPRAAPA